MTVAPFPRRVRRGSRLFRLEIPLAPHAASELQHGHYANCRQGSHRTKAAPGPSLAQIERICAYDACCGEIIRVDPNGGYACASSARGGSGAPGVYLLLEGSSIDAIQDRVDTLPFAVKGLMTLDYEEIYEI